MIRKMKGSLLLTVDELETAHIPEEDREMAISRYYEMKLEAEKHNDCFYALESIYRHSFSYGNFYPGFVNMSWSEFLDCETLKGISQTTFQMMQTFCQRPNIETVMDEDEFQEREEPHARSGYCNPNGVKDFVNNMTSWEEWHRRWYSCHQEQIDWDCVGDSWFPRPDLIIGILKRELIAELGHGIVESIDDSDVVNVFYDRVMRHKGNETEAYASKIGGEVCLRNYYVFEQELSTIERQYAKSLRRIFSIINKHGMTQFISIDFAHGMFEFHDERGVHLGEYRFDGSYNSGAEASHSLHKIESWRRRYGR